MQQQPRGSYVPRIRSDTQSTPSILNEVYSRLRASSDAYDHACGIKKLTAIHTWMRSYADRLTTMANHLQDEGARHKVDFDTSAIDFFDDANCESPTHLLKIAERNQSTLLEAYEQITERLDMDAELYELVTDQHQELDEVLTDITTLRREYEVYGS